MGFDRLAPHYRWMEWLLAGAKLQRCRTAFIDQISSPAQALLLGEGNGRFLTELLRVYPKASVTCLDASAAMLSSARARLHSAGLIARDVEFVHADVLDWSPPDRLFDLVVTHFFLDCFRADQIQRIVSRIAQAATSQAHWLLADFQAPAKGPARWRARLILWVMYRFFRWSASLPAEELTAPDPYALDQGFALQERRYYEWGLLHTDLWTRGVRRSLTDVQIEVPGAFRHDRGWVRDGFSA